MDHKGAKASDGHCIEWERKELIAVWGDIPSWCVEGDDDVRRTERHRRENEHGITFLLKQQKGKEERSLSTRQPKSVVLVLPASLAPLLSLFCRRENILHKWEAFFAQPDC